VNQPVADFSTVRGFEVAELFRRCYQHAWEHSDDPKTKNGSLLLPDWSNPDLIMGCNHLPPGYEPTQENLKSENKDNLIIHAEEDAIWAAAKEGTPTDGAVLICCWAPCVRCARAIMMAGISRLIVHKEMHDRTYEKYLANIEEAICMLCNAGIEYQQWSGEVGGCRGLMNHEIWSP